MIVVSNTGPINYLALIGHLDALPTLDEHLLTPPAAMSPFT